jgi:hypothetical protein
MNHVINPCWHDKAITSVSDTTTQATRYCPDCGLSETTFPPLAAQPTTPAPGPVAQGELLDEMRAFVNLMKGAALEGEEFFSAPRCKQIFEECVRLNGKYLNLPASDTLRALLEEARDVLVTANEKFMYKEIPSTRIYEVVAKINATLATPQVEAVKDSVHSDSGDVVQGPADKAVVKLRFFRDLSQDQRLSLFRTFSSLDDEAASEVRSHAHETILFNFVWLSTWRDKFIRAIDAAILSSDKAQAGKGAL